MPTTTHALSIAGAYRVDFHVAEDFRGQFSETYRKSWFPNGREMVQGNLSSSKKGVLRGLHFHRKQADFWTVPVGSVRVGLFDLRPETYGSKEVLELSRAAPSGLYIPRGVAHGFLALEDSLLSYLVDEYYDGTDEHGILWNDPDVGLSWGYEGPILSERDQRNPRLRDVPPLTTPVV